MKKLAVILLVFLAAVFVAGCDPYDVEVATFKSPDFASMRYSRVLVCVDSKDLITKKNFENELKYNFLKYSVRAATDSETFPPTNTYTEADRLQTMKRDGFDAYLVLAIDDYKVDKHQVAPTSQWTTGQIKQDGDNTTYVQQTQQVGGYTETNMKVTYSAKLFDVATNKVAWMGTMKMSTDSEYYTNSQVLASETAKALVNKLVTDNMLNSKTPAK